MERMHPERLQGDQYMASSSSFRIFHHSVNSHIHVHWHDFYELAFILSGSGSHVLNGISQPVSKGMVFLLTPADFHEVIPYPGSTIELYNMIFVESFMGAELYELLFKDQSNHVFTFKEDEMINLQAEFEWIWEESKESKEPKLSEQPGQSVLSGQCIESGQLEQPQVGSKLLIRGAFERILIQLARRTKSKGMNVRHSDTIIHPSIQKSLIYLQHHFREQFTLADIAEKVGLSANYFSEIFRIQTGQTFQSFVQQSRLQFAKSLLLTTELPITEIAYASGFQTFSNFERAFKKKFGRPPSTYKKDHR